RRPPGGSGVAGAVAARWYRCRDVTTRQGSRSRSRTGASSRSSRSSGAGRSTGRGAGRSGAGSRSRARRSQPSLTGRALRTSARVLGEHADDVGGLLLLALAVICGLGVYAGRGGPVGRGLGELAASALGWLRLALPPLLALGGAALILRRGDGDAGDEDAQPSVTAHVAVGTALLVVACAGILHVTGGRPALDAPVEQLRDAGGWLGVGVGGPLVSLVGTAGALVVLGVVAVGGLVVLTRTPLRDAVDRMLGSARTLTHGLNRRLATLFRLPYDDGDRADDAATTGELEPGLRPDDDTLVESSEDGAAPEPEAEATAAEPPRRPRPAPEIVVPEPDDAPPEQLEIALGPAAKASPWKLPPLTLLERSGS